MADLDQILCVASLDVGKGCFVFAILAFKNTKKMSAKYIDVNVKRRFPTHFPGI